MITPAEARELIRLNIPRPEVQEVLLLDCVGCVLAEDVTAPFPMPMADNSAMDGFVVRFADVCQASPNDPVRLIVQGTVKAGDSRQTSVSSGTASRIMTGALIPQGGDAVIPKEEALVLRDAIVVKKPVRLGQHIRRRAEEIRKGQKLLEKESILNPAAVGILASMGYARVPVYRKPRVALLATGSELVPPGKRLAQGQIYDSNSWMIRAALLEIGMVPVQSLRLRDNVQRVRKAVRRLLGESDILILLGGVSVGDYDVTKKALTQEGVRTIFWKVCQKPGKPLFLGRKGKKIIFGLPGNPAAVFTCFYEYVYPALQQFRGFKNTDLEQIYVRVDTAILADHQKHLFLKARLCHNKNNLKNIREAEILAHQGSHMLSSLARAQGFIHVPPRLKSQQKKWKLAFHRLPVRSNYEN